jgi:hypothetical protein
LKCVHIKVKGLEQILLKCFWKILSSKYPWGMFWTILTFSIVVLYNFNILKWGCILSLLLSILLKAETVIFVQFTYFFSLVFWVFFITTLQGNMNEQKLFVPFCSKKDLYQILKLKMVYPLNYTTLFLTSTTFLSKYLKILWS